MRYGRQTDDKHNGRPKTMNPALQLIAVLLLLLGLRIRPIEIAHRFMTSKSMHEPENIPLHQLHVSELLNVK